MISAEHSYRIATLGGDGIGPEVMASAVMVLEAIQETSPLTFDLRSYLCGASCYQQLGDPLPLETLQGCRQADAILLGAMGLPNVRWPDGTEMRPQVDLRFKLDLYAGLRPIYLYHSDHTPIKGLSQGDIDFVIVRENVEGLFASMNSGIEIRDEVAIDSMVMTKSGTERIIHFAFNLAIRRQKKRKVTCVDKANVFRSMAFFRQIYDRIAKDYPSVSPDHAYIDAFALYLLQKPQTYDIIVTENMYGDILSDLAAGLVGGMGMAPSADIGEHSAVFQPSHGTAPDIAGQNIANPIAMILSVKLMLLWLADQKKDPVCTKQASRLSLAVSQVLSDNSYRTPDLGGNLTTTELSEAIANFLRKS